MKILCAVLIVVLTAMVAGPAAGEIVEVSTSVTMPAPATDEDLRVAVRAAAAEVLSQMRSLDPVIMLVTGAYLSAGRLHVRFLIADEAGAQLLDEWDGKPDDREAKPDSNDPGWRI